MKTYICVYLASAFAATVLTPMVIWLARRIGAVDRPNVRSVHKRPIPRIGGIAIFVSAVIMVAVLPFLHPRIGDHFVRVRTELIVLLCSAAFIFAVGLYDDLKGLPARYKLAAQVLASGALCLAGVRIGNIGVLDGFEIDLFWLAWPVTMLWMVGLTNAVNLSDGLDGLAAGVSAIACAVIAIFALTAVAAQPNGTTAQSNDVMMALFALALLGSLSGFLIFNFNPAKVFMGDCGSQFLGFTLAATSVMCVSKSRALAGLALPVLALGIPIFDTLFSMLRRFLERRSLFAPDRSHFHHKLLDRGFSQRRVVLSIYVATLAVAGGGLGMLVVDNMFSLLLFGGLLVCLVLLFHFVGAIRIREILLRLQEKRTLSNLKRREREAFEHLQLMFRQTRDADEAWQAVCEAAYRMEFAWVALRNSYSDGRVEEELWRYPDVDPDLSRIVTVTIPLSNGNGCASRQFEIAIQANGSIESASRRAVFFGRLIDENILRMTASGHNYGTVLQRAGAALRHA